MNKLKMNLFIVLIPFVCSAYEWSTIDSKDVSVNEYLSSMLGEVLCVSDGILIYAGKKTTW